jgi:hypothetical protein
VLNKIIGNNKETKKEARVLLISAFALLAEHITARSLPGFPVRPAPENRKMRQ